MRPFRSLCIWDSRSSSRTEDQSTVQCAIAKADCEAEEQYVSLSRLTQARETAMNDAPLPTVTNASCAISEFTGASVRLEILTYWSSYGYCNTPSRHP